MPQASEYAIKPLNLKPEGIQEIAKLMDIVWPQSHLNFDYLHWLYNLNPAGSAVGFNAYIEDRLAGHYVAVPIRALVKGEVRQGLLSLNTAVHPLDRGHRLFNKLAEKTYEKAQDLDYSFVVGVANENSTGVFINRLGFQCIGSLSAQIGWGPAPLSYVPKPREGFERLWDAELLNWRLDRPGAHYQTIKSNKGVHLFAPTGKWGIKAQLGFFDSQKISKEYSKLTSLNPLKLWIGFDLTPEAKSHYFEMPKFCRPSPLNLILRDFSDSQPFDPYQIRFRLIDFDAY